MMRTTSTSLRYVTFTKPRYYNPPAQYPVRSVFPLIYSNNLLSKPRKKLEDFPGRQGFDDDHQAPVMGSTSTEHAGRFVFNHYELRLNPQLIQSHRDLRSNSEYAGPRAGYLFPQTGWHKPGANWKEAKNYHINKKGPIMGEWLERHITPRFMLAPRVCPGGPRSRYEGKLAYSIVSLPRIIWSIESGKLNPNEPITLRTLVEAGVVHDRNVLWPGFKIISGGVTELPMPLHIELQRADQPTINAIEKAGGTFTAVYLSPEGIHQELNPDQYPTFLDADMPNKLSMDRVMSQPKQRGYLSQWVNESSQYAHPDSGRRLAHYVKPPVDRDFPTTFAEYEAVKHHQKWHLNQAGSGTVLPWNYLNTLDVRQASSGTI